MDNKIINIPMHESYENVVELYEGLAKKNAEDDDHRNDLMTYYESWHNIYEGEKAVILLTRNNECIASLRLWATPYVEHQWYIEELFYHTEEEISSMIDYVITHVDKSTGKIHANVHMDNQKHLHSLIAYGFKAKTQGTVNVYGQWRENYNLLTLSIPI